MTIVYCTITGICCYVFGILTIALVSNNDGYDKGYKDGYDQAKQDQL